MTLDRWVSSSPDVSEYYTFSSFRIKEGNEIPKIMPSRSLKSHTTWQKKNISTKQKIEKPKAMKINSTNCLMHGYWFCLCFVDRASLYNPFQIKPTRCALLLSIFISISVHVSGNYVPIIKRIYCIWATLVFFTVYEWLAAGWDETGLIPTSRPDSHPYTVKNTSVA